MILETNSLSLLFKVDQKLFCNLSQNLQKGDNKPVFWFTVFQNYYQLHETMKTDG